MTAFLKDLKKARVRRVGRRPRIKVSMSDDIRNKLNHAAKLSGVYVSDVIEALVDRYLTFEEGEEPPVPVGAPVDYVAEPEPEPEVNTEDDEWLGEL